MHDLNRFRNVSNLILDNKPFMTDNEMPDKYLLIIKKGQICHVEINVYLNLCTFFQNLINVLYIEEFLHLIESFNE